jgi:hypothetical protein
MKKLFLIVMSAGICVTAAAQLSPREVYGRMQQAYQQAPGLAFDVFYTYESKARPGLVEDSLRGAFLMNNKQYWGRMDSTEFIKDDSISITLFHEDRVMMLAKTTDDAQMPGPLQLHDSLFKNNSNYSFTHRTNGKTGIFQIVFKDRTSNWHSIEMKYNTSTWLLEEMVMEVDDPDEEGGDLTQTLRSGSSTPKSSLKESVGKAATGIVRMRFFNYHKEINGMDKMKLQAYYSKEGGKYYPADAYTGYEVFLSTEGF